MYTPLNKSKSKPAREFKFKLDPFQDEAISCVENNRSVLVSAHTSSGKTVVAEYCIAKALKSHQKVIYTTPIKSLSNQKFREFKEEFEDVGLITGDVCVNPKAKCLIMTPEILRNLLYKGSKASTEVAWLIFDEIHYMKDKERGVVWEECIILLPDTVRYVFLSATIPNARDFGRWISWLHKQPCHIVYSNSRPTPLQHYVLPTGGNGIYMVVNEAGKILPKNLETTIAIASGPYNLEPGTRLEMLKDCHRIIKLIVEKNLDPALVFSFGRKECEMHARQLAELDLNSTEEKVLCGEIMENAISVLSTRDKELPQVTKLIPLLERGIGIHHGGMIPILRETVEVLFSEGLIKVLFTTETFALGLNMPAKTVVFTSLKKFDGKVQRFISAGEYIQMSGRAGRRGLDKSGFVISVIDSHTTMKDLSEILQGKADPITSAFTLTPRMVLNTLRVDGICPEFMLERSFGQFQKYFDFPRLIKEYSTKLTEYSNTIVEEEEKIRKMFILNREILSMEEKAREWLYTPRLIVPFLQPGRLMQAMSPTGEEYDWGIILGHKDPFQAQPGSYDSISEVVIDLLVPNLAGKDIACISLSSKSVLNLSSLRVKFSNDLDSTKNREAIISTLQSIKAKFGTGVPLLNPKDDLKAPQPVIDLLFEINCKKVEREELKFKENTRVLFNYEKYCQKNKIEEELISMEREIQHFSNINEMGKLKCWKTALRRLGYCWMDDSLSLKGRIACEIKGAHEILVTEILLSNICQQLAVPQLLALLSCLCCESNTCSGPPPKLEFLEKPLCKIQEIIDLIESIMAENDAEINKSQLMLKTDLSEVVYHWARGASFSEVTLLTNAFEGVIIRCLHRLEEFLRHLSHATRKMSHLELEAKFLEGIILIRRDIPFANSLYL
jgi:ATP-dependent RNA helicase DOB1